MARVLLAASVMLAASVALVVRVGLLARVILAAGVVLAASPVLVGCGGGSSGGARGTRGATSPAVAVDAPIVIARPADGSQLAARATKGGALRVVVRLRGTTRPGGSVFLHAGCRPRRCAARAVAASDGGWAKAMTVTTTRAARFVTIDASSRADLSTPGSAVTTVELIAPRRPRTVGRSSGRPPASVSLPPPRRPLLPHDVLMIGDSLAVGTAEDLQAALPGWQVRTDGRVSRPLAEGMRILASSPDPPAILAFSLFTNDDPSATGALEQAVRATATRAGGCAVWATIVRPPYNGVSYDAANRVLETLAADPRLSLQIVDWSGLVARNPSYVGGDGVHATPAGYRARAQLYAAAIRACAGEG